MQEWRGKGVRKRDGNEEAADGSPMHEWLVACASSEETRWQGKKHSSYILKLASNTMRVGSWYDAKHGGQ